MEKKRYILFGYSDYYPAGGMEDALFSFNTREELLAESDDITGDGFNVLDTETFKVGKGWSSLEAYEDLLSK